MTTNPFTPQDAERLRETRGKAVKTAGYQSHRPFNGYFLCDLYEAEAESIAAYMADSANAVPAMLDLIDALREVVQGYYTSHNSSTYLTREDCCCKQCEATRTGPHAVWLKQGR